MKVLGARDPWYNCPDLYFYLLCFLQDEKTPLHIAADYGREKVAELLLGKGANPNAADKVGMQLYVQMVGS